MPLQTLRALGHYTRATHARPVPILRTKTRLTTYVFPQGQVPSQRKARLSIHKSKLSPPSPT
jgi:hypothetical protein